MAGYLPEVSEADAEGAVKELYDDIRAVVGLPLVNLVYRHLAVEPSRLEAAWSRLRPNLTDEAIDDAAAELLEAGGLELPPLSSPALAAVGAGPTEVRAVALTLDAYNHANPRNLVALLSLLHGVTGTATRRTRPQTRPRHFDVLPIAALQDVQPAALSLLDEMAKPFAAPGQATLIPSLFRHFADRPGLLAVFWTALQPAARGGTLARSGDLVARRAAALAAGLPHPVPPTTDPETTAVLRGFTRTISRMTAAGVALREALDGALGAAASID